MTQSERLADALAAYSVALDAGEALSHDRVLAQFPDLGAELGPLLAQVDRLHQVRAEVRPGRSGDPLGFETRLGDFEIVSLLGRGGMGTVYEAIQHPIGRRVALKVVPAASDLDRRVRDRFLHEAKIAALLHHEHIVPVYAVGEAADIAYYAMQLIEGRSLASVLGELRADAVAPRQPQPLGAAQAGPRVPPAASSAAAEAAGNPRSPDPVVAALGPPGSTAYRQSVVRLVAQAADALSYAHEMGVVHRDVKPGNLLLDRQGKLWLADFGLAYARDGGGSSIGHAVGTPRYIAPEHLDPGLGPADGRADLFSLGATLYELLCLHHAFDAEGQAAIFRQILQDGPTPLRKRDPAIPIDLATIVARTMAKDPRDRYATAADLAADLRRFLDGRPVVARPLSPLQHAHRWARRHRRGLAAGAIALACGLILGLASSTTVFFRQKVHAEDRERQLLEVVRSLNGAEELFRNQPGAGAGHRVLVQQLHDVLTRLADEPDAPRPARWEAANACLRLAGLEEREGRFAASLDATAEAIRRFRALAADHPGDTDSRLALAQALRFEVSLRFNQDHDWSKAAQIAREAVAIYAGLEREDPDRAAYRNDISGLCGVIATDHAVRGEYEQAIAATRQGLAADESLARQFPDGHPLSYIRLTLSWGRLAGHLAQAGQAALAEEACRRALANDAILASRFPDPPNNRKDTFGSAGDFGRFLLARGRYAEAREVFAAYLADARRFAALYAEQVWWRPHEVLALQGLADAGYLEGRDSEAESAYGAFLDSLALIPEGLERQRFAVQVPLAHLAARVVRPISSHEDDAPSFRYLAAVSLLRQPDGARAAADLLEDLTDRAGVGPDLRGAAGYRLAQARARFGPIEVARQTFTAAEQQDGDRVAVDGLLRLARREAAIELGRNP